MEFSFQELLPEFGLDSVDDWLYTGFYPRIYDQNLNPSQALSDYFATYVERDLRKIVNIRNLSQFEKFVRLCAGRVGQVLNVSSLANFLQFLPRGTVKPAEPGSGGSEPVIALEMGRRLGRIED